MADANKENSSAASNKQYKKYWGKHNVLRRNKLVSPSRVIQLLNLALAAGYTVLIALLAVQEDGSIITTALLTSTNGIRTGQVMRHTREWPDGSFSMCDDEELFGSSATATVSTQTSPTLALAQFPIPSFSPLKFPEEPLSQSQGTKEFMADMALCLLSPCKAFSPPEAPLIFTAPAAKKQRLF